MSIGIARADELPEICRLARATDGIVGHPLHVYRILHDHFGRFMLAARDQGELVGFQQGFPSTEREGVYFLWQIGIRADSRMNGLAGDLVREAERLARGAGCTAVQATVDVRNVPSRSLFTSLGYRNASFGDIVEIDGERVMPDYYGSGTDQILFQKEI